MFTSHDWVKIYLWILFSWRSLIGWWDLLHEWLVFSEISGYSRLLTMRQSMTLEMYPESDSHLHRAFRVANITDFFFHRSNGIQKMIRISPDFYAEFWHFRIFYGFCNFLIFFNIFSLSINTYGETEIPVFRRCMAGMIEHAVQIISIIKK